jgi:hypothetical protein
MENIFELVDKKLKKLREQEAKQSTTNDKDPINNTGDEATLEKIINQLPTLLSRLEKFDQIIELDGLFKSVLEKTSLEDVPKTTIIAALAKALKDIAPASPTVTTKKPKPFTKK